MSELFTSVQPLYAFTLSKIKSQCHYDHFDTKLTRNRDKSISKSKSKMKVQSGGGGEGEGGELNFLLT